jgi:hypothetical protein
MRTEISEKYGLDAEIKGRKYLNFPKFPKFIPEVVSLLSLWCIVLSWGGSYIS